MRSRPIVRYIFAGTVLRYLQDVAAGYQIGGDGWVLENVGSFLAYLGEFELPVTVAAAHQLRALRAELAEAIALDEGATLTPDQAKRIRDEMGTLRTTLEAEAGLNIAFITTEKRIDVKKLLNDVGSLMSPGVFGQLPAMAKDDLQSAGRCIAFELPTASAFHVLRATEDVLRHFYVCVIRQNRVKNPTWGTMIQQMRKKKTNAPDSRVLDVLDRIRDNFRNPTAHPDSVYDIHEAQDLFLACAEAIGRMVKSPQWVKIAGT